MKTKFYNLPKYKPEPIIWYDYVFQTPIFSFYKELERKEKMMKEVMRRGVEVVVDKRVTKV